ncbi:MAG: hypothetical protein AAGJ84_05855 [Pseudomonadota bacterium]
MRKYLLIGTVLAASAAPAMAQDRVTLEDAINGLLANGCQGTYIESEDRYVGGLLTADEFEAGTPTRTGTPERIEYDYSVYSANVVGQEPEIDAEASTREALVDPPPDWDVVFDSAPPAASGVVPDGVIDLFIDTDDLAATFYYTGNSPTPTNAPGGQQDPFEVEAIRTVFAEVTNSFGPGKNSGGGALLGGGLETLCTTQTAAYEQEETTRRSTFFGFDASAGQKIGGSISPTVAPGGVPVLGGAVGSNAGSVRAQEGLARREGGLRAIFSRLRKKAERENREEERAREQAARGIQLASIGTIPISALSSGTITAPRDRPFTLVTDLSGGFVNIERQETDLASAFDADSVVINASAALLFGDDTATDSSLLFGGAVSFESTESETSSGENNLFDQFETEAWTGSVFAGWNSNAFDFGGTDNAAWSFSLLGSAGQGDQTYDRSFSQEYTPDLGVDSDMDGEADVAIASGQFGGDVDQDFMSVSLQSSLSVGLGGVTVAPRASVTWAQFETGAHEESMTGVASMGGEGLALRYEAVEDEWVESRLGGSLTYSALISDTTVLDLTLGSDAIFVSDAETPIRTAFFAQDLRGADAAQIRYNVDDLDDQYFDVNVSAALDFSSGWQPYVSYFTRQGHDYIDAQGGLFGVRLTY